MMEIMSVEPAPAPPVRARDVPVVPPITAGRRAVLHAVRRAGDATADEVAEALEITVSGARQHLGALLDDGLVATADEAPTGRRGRPQLRYHTTALADAVFPKAYSALTNELLGYLADEDTETVSRLFARRRDHRIAAATERLAHRRSLKAKVEELARILDEDGYLATSEQVSRDVFRVVEHNCAIAEVARRYGQACTSELDFIRAVLPDADVERVSHMVAGARHCAYEVRRSRP
jgi:predicted ArsR family transcriptional regulator